jgi:hypothetical protein
VAPWTGVCVYILPSLLFVRGIAYSELSLHYPMVALG